MTAATPTLIYIHGFQSSPLSQKAVETADYLQGNRPDIRLLVPELPDYPLPAIMLLEQIIAGCDGPVGLIGSSLGGFYATYLADKYNLKAVLINPAVAPHVLISDYLGKNVNPYTGNVYYLTHDHLSHFERLHEAELQHPENCWLMVQRGDETLDYRLATAKYCDSPQLIEPGGDHRFQGYQQKMPEILRFLTL
ncbi:hypothetical protein EDC56_3044 [Sinobacterium caligoides]|uniref:Esterase n=1 Tax=Sinobacterium caligoides TaxID=933926 RepID=A0A3N2DGD8_9GAMM|nr:YqiA/YcfP family alpha/beta fold hydrolase [Sinobacterium caligoides]ROR98809.1 hypothetical protein EDC56_3044 [Sinobacterium caligoides]